MLTADDYGFHHGDVWYRGRDAAAGAATSISLRYGGDGAGLLQAWLDGRYLGQNVLPTGLSAPPTTGTATFTIPPDLQTDGPHLLSVMVRDDSHNEDGGTNDAEKEGRGLISAAFTDAGSAQVPTSVAWKIQGDQGGEDIADAVRGPVNNGGLYGERAGWYLPGCPDLGWSSATVPAAGTAAATAAGADAPAAADPAPGTTWYRTTFRLSVPSADDASLGITIGDPSSPAIIGQLPGTAVRQRLEHGPVHRQRRPAAHIRDSKRRAGSAWFEHACARGHQRPRRRQRSRAGRADRSRDRPGRCSAAARSITGLRRTASGPLSSARLAGRRVQRELAAVSLPADAAGTELRATVDWGDGTTSPGTLDGSGASRTVSAGHTYASAGRYRVRVAIDDAVSGAGLAAGQTVASVAG